MKNVKLFFAGLVAVMLVSSCGIMNDSSSIQKRKYSNGFYISKNKSWAKSKSDSKSEKLEEEKLANESVVLEEKVLATPIVLDQTQVPAVKKNEKSDQAEDQKASQKKEETKKVTSTEKKSTATPAKSRKERVPERYLPMKKEAVKNKLSHQSAGHMDDFQLLCVILTILIPFVGVAVYTNLDVKKTLITLLLTLLLYIPGLIYGLLVVLDKI